MDDWIIYRYCGWLGRGWGFGDGGDGGWAEEEEVKEEEEKEVEDKKKDDDDHYNDMIDIHNIGGQIMMMHYDRLKYTG